MGAASRNSFDHQCRKRRPGPRSLGSPEDFWMHERRSPLARETLFTIAGSEILLKALSRNFTGAYAPGNFLNRGGDGAIFKRHNSHVWVVLRQTANCSNIARDKWNAESHAFQQHQRNTLEFTGKDN